MQTIVTGLFPRSQNFSYFRQIVNDVNIELGNACSLYQILFCKPSDDRLQANGKLNLPLFWDDDLHLSKTGYQKFATSLFNFISSCNKSKPTFNLRKVDKSFPPLSRTNIQIPTEKTIYLFKKHKFCKPKYIHKSFVHGLHVRKVSVLVPVTAICVISSSFLISANISKPVLVTASTVSVISDVTMQKPMSVIDKLAPFKTNQVKGNSQEWFDGEVLESIASPHKLFKKFKYSKLNVNKEIYNKARNKSDRLENT